MTNQSPRSVSDLAEALKNDNGVFLSLDQNTGQPYLVVSAPGHSIVSIQPLSQAINQLTSSQSSQGDRSQTPAWRIVKIADLEETYQRAAGR